MKRFEKRVAIVTGAARGLGAVIAQRLSAEGAIVVVVDIDGAGAKTMAEKIGGGAFAVTTDVGDASAVTALHNQVLHHSGKIDVLINNAGIIPYVPWDKLTLEEWRRVMRVNLDGVFLMSRASSDVMRKHGYGRIVNICSNVVFSAPPNLAHYVASKGGVFALTRVLATELGAYDITVNQVCPGLIETEGLKSSPHRDSFAIAEMMQAIKIKGVPTDVVPAVAFLASEEAQWITGAALNVDAGMVRW